MFVHVAVCRSYRWIKKIQKVVVNVVSMVDGVVSFVHCNIKIWTSSWSCKMYECFS